MDPHQVVSREEWLVARRRLLAREKEATHLRDAVNAERLALPWVKVEKAYRFDTPEGPKTLAELFGPRSQLIVYHFMLGPDWTAGCPGCSFLADHLDGALPHLEHHDVTLTAVSRGPLAKIEAYKTRMGWHFPWVSSNRSSFNFDFHVSFTPEQLAKGKVEYNYTMIDGEEELPGINVFAKNAAGEVFHSYSSYGRGAEELITTYMVLDLTPKGRNENGPHHNLMDWVKRHDEYETAKAEAGCCGE